MFVLHLPVATAAMALATEQVQLHHRQAEILRNFKFIDSNSQDKKHHNEWYELISFKT